MKNKVLSSSKILNILLALCMLVLLLKSNNKQSGEKITDEKSYSTIEVIHQRKSVRHFTDRQVTKEQLTILLKAAMAAPTAVNKQPWSFVVVTEKETLQKLAEILPYAKMTAQASAAIVVNGDMNKALDGVWKEFWIQDCSAATQNILLAAESMGLGAVWTGVYPTDKLVNSVRKSLNIPDSQVPLCVIPIGYPTGEDKPKNKWKPENIHWQKYE